MKQVCKILDALFPDPRITLLYSDPYTLLIATLLSAQCTDARVNQITPKLPKSPQEMIALTPEQIAEIIRPCGLALRKSRAIFSLSQILLKKYRGQVPNAFRSLEALPGVGHKTASVVLAQAFQIPTFPVDTHIFRSAKRWGLSVGNTIQAVEKDLKKLFPKRTWIRRHLQMIHYARAYCPARGHKQKACPICCTLSLS